VEKKETVPQKTPSQLPTYGFVISIFSLIAIILAGRGSSWGWWHFRTGFTILEYGAYGGISAGLISMIGLAMNRKYRDRLLLYLGIAGLVVGLLTVGIPWSWLKIAKTVPPIHDIATDTINPPQFEYVIPLREGALNSLQYGGPEVAKLQKEFYPDIVPAILLNSPEVSFKRALKVGRDMGWEIIDADPAQGRIEATATTTWFGFKDDIVILIQSYEGGSLINVRSVSRVGKSDVGTNAMRIRQFLGKL